MLKGGNIITENQCFCLKFGINPLYLQKISDTMAKRQLKEVLKALDRNRLQEL